MRRVSQADCLTQIERIDHAAGARSPVAHLGGRHSLPHRDGDGRATVDYGVLAG